VKPQWHFLVITSRNTQSGSKEQRVDGDSDDEEASSHLFRSPYVPTCRAAVEEFLKIAHVGENDVVCDIGCGDGRVLAMAAELGAKGIGFEIDQELHERATKMLAKEKKALRERVVIYNQPAEGARLIEALQQTTVLFLFLLPKAIRSLEPIILAQMQPKTRIVTYTFRFGDSLVPVKSINYRSSVTPLRMYEVPSRQKRS